MFEYRARVLFAAAFLATSCAMNAVGPSYAEAKPTDVRDDVALVYVVRQYAEPTAMPAMILVGDATVGDLNQKGFTWFYAKPGHREIRAQWGLMSGQAPSRISLDLEAGKTYYLELLGVSQASGDYLYLGSGLVGLREERAVAKLQACMFQRPRASVY
jgi:hypothetical protein